MSVGSGFGGCREGSGSLLAPAPRPPLSRGVTGGGVDILAPSWFPLLGRAQTTPSKSPGSGIRTPDKGPAGAVLSGPPQFWGQCPGRAPSGRLPRLCRHWGRKRFCGTVGGGLRLKQALNRPRPPPWDTGRGSRPLSGVAVGRQSLPRPELDSGHSPDCPALQEGRLAPQSGRSREASGTPASFARQEVASGASTFKLTVSPRTLNYWCPVIVR